jgi:hypothetical protein
MSLILSAILLALGVLTKTFGHQFLGMALILISVLAIIISSISEYKNYQAVKKLRDNYTRSRFLR